ncbi:MAG: hypothetical protein ACP5KY_06770 [Thermoproteus sp.]
MKPAMFLAYLDESTRAMILTKLKAMGLKPERLMSDEAAFFSALRKALGQHNFEMLMKAAEELDSTVRKAREALDDPAAFVAVAAEVPDDVVARLGGAGSLQANRGLGCPEPLAKAAALAKALLHYMPEEGARLAQLESKLWEVMTRDCAVLSALANQIYSVEEA